VQLLQQKKVTQFQFHCYQGQNIGTKVFKRNLDSADAPWSITIYHRWQIIFVNFIVDLVTVYNQN